MEACRAMRMIGSDEAGGEWMRQLHNGGPRYTCRCRCRCRHRGCGCCVASISRRADGGPGGGDGRVQHADSQPSPALRRCSAVIRPTGRCQRRGLGWWARPSTGEAAQPSLGSVVALALSSSRTDQPHWALWHRRIVARAFRLLLALFPFLFVLWLTSSTSTTRRLRNNNVRRDQFNGTSPTEHPKQLQTTEEVGEGGGEADALSLCKTNVTQAVLSVATGG